MSLDDQFSVPHIVLPIVPMHFASQWSQVIIVSAFCDHVIIIFDEGA